MSFLFVPRLPREGQKRKAKTAAAAAAAAHDHGHGHSHGHAHAQDDAPGVRSGAEAGGRHGAGLREAAVPAEGAFVQHYAVAREDYDAGGPLSLALLRREHDTAL